MSFPQWFTTVYYCATVFYSLFKGRFVIKSEIYEGTSLGCWITKNVNRLKDVLSIFFFWYWHLFRKKKNCQHRKAKFDKCQKSNSVFIIQTSEKGMNLAMKSSIQALSTVHSHLLPAHTHKHSSRTTTALYRAYKEQSMFMASITSLIWTEMALRDICRIQWLWASHLTMQP